MVVINKITPQTCDLYTPSGELLGTVNEYEFMDARVQIKRQKLEGYYAIFNIDGEDVRLNIDKNGRSWDWCNGMFDTLEKSMSELL